MFRSGDVPGACEQFHQAVEQDENNHKAWNALGICLSKSDEYEDADTCFENALMLDPGNSTYERNRERNSLKIPIRRPEKKPAGPTHTNTRKEYDSGYQRNWLQVPLYLVPMILAIANPVVGFLAVIACAYYIKRDAESLNAGMNPSASLWGKMKGWEWMLLLILFWILLPLYSWKREQIYEENLGYGSAIPKQTGSSLIKTGAMAVGFLFLCMVIAVFVFGFSNEVPNAAGKQASMDVKPVSLAGNPVTFQPTQQVMAAPVVVSTPAVSLAEKNAAKKARDYLRVIHFSRAGLIRQLTDFEKYSHAEAVYGVDNSGANWNEQAAGKAKDYLDVMPFSRDGLIKQLVDFEKFTPEQAEYGVRSVGL